jgi:N-acyl-D-aspartate/D-glutamate deacylase
LHALSDAGAHVGSICDASLPTSLLLYWRNKIGLEKAIHLLTQRNAQHMGINDRGVIQVGKKADLNLIDPTQLGLSMPFLVNDLPAGGKRFLQTARGYIGTWVNGQPITHQGRVSANRPGKMLVPSPQIASN